MPFVFDTPPDAGWLPALRRAGRVMAPIARTRDIVVPFRAAALIETQHFPLVFGPSIDAFATLDSVPPFLGFMQAKFPDLLPRAARPGEFPCIAKDARSIGGRGVRIVARPADMPARPACVQAAVRGRYEFVDHIAAWRGRVIARARLLVDLGEELAIKRGAVPGIEVPADAMFGRIFMALSYSGFACVNFKMDGGGPRVFEINPRLGGSLVLSPRLGQVLRLVEEFLCKSMPA